MSETICFVIYLAVFRLCVFAVAIISLILGYKLLNSVYGLNRQKNDASLELKVQKISVKFKKAAPGLFYALFGVLLIAIMLIQNAPEIKLYSKQVSNTSFCDSTKLKIIQIDEMSLKSGGVSQPNHKNDEFLQAVVTAGSLSNYYANICFQDGKYHEAVKLAKIATVLCPDSVIFESTLSNSRNKLAEYAKKF